MTSGLVCSLEQYQSRGQVYVSCINACQRLKFQVSPLHFHSNNLTQDQKLVSFFSFFFFGAPPRPATRSPGGEVGGVAVVVVIWTHLLHQLVVGAVEGDEDADDFEGLGAQPGHVALGLLLRAALRRVVGTQ